MSIQKSLQLLIFGFTLASSFSSLAEAAKRSSPPLQNPEQILLDTDGAVFWDDGAALAMLLRHSQQIHIVGITMVIGNEWPFQGAEYMARVMKVSGQPQIPIFIGADQPLKNTAKQLGEIEADLIRTGVLQKGFWKGAYGSPVRNPKEVRTYDQVEPAKGEALTGIAPQPQAAADFIIDTLMNSPKPMTFVALGPLTNLAVAIKRQPKIIPKIKKLVFMGGAIRVPGNTTPYAEVNIIFDPEAAQIVISSAIREKILFPLDLNDLVTIAKSDYEEIVSKGTPISTLLKADREPRYNANPDYKLQAWDTLVSAYLIDPSYITGSEDMFIKVVEEVGPHYGQMVQQKSKDQNFGKVRVMNQLNAKQFLEILKNNLL